MSCDHQALCGFNLHQLQRLAIDGWVRLRHAQQLGGQQHVEGQIRRLCQV